jgi:HK97 family phage prohead protease
MLVRKTHSSESENGLEFILSTYDEDRYGDRIVQEGWKTDNFKKNPIALLNHDKNFPIGKWKDLRVQDGALRGHLQMAPQGTSSRHDEIRKLIDAGILRAVSVGFLPIESEPLVKSGGTKYIKAELVETSLVAIPANPNALQISKALGVSKETLQMVFKRNNNATIPGRSRVTVNNNKVTIAERIAQSRRALASLEKAQAVLKRSKATLEKSKAAQPALPKKPAPKPPEQRWPSGVTWRGQNIPNSWFNPAMRKNWWDPKS